MRREDQDDEKTVVEDGGREVSKVRWVRPETKGTDRVLTNVQGQSHDGVNVRETDLTSNGLST